MPPFSSDRLRDILALDLVDLADIWRLFGLHVSGVEVTQAIQYYRASEHLTDAADRGADNSVTLVTGKPAWARVYLRSGLHGGDIVGVTGTLEVQKRHAGFLYSTLATLAAQAPGSVTAHESPAYATERGTLTSSLNFILPADVMCGHLKLIATITTPDGRTATREMLLDVTLRQTLRLRGVMVGYNGPSSTAAGAPNLTIAAPTVADLQTTSAWSLLVFPVESVATYSSAGAITLTVPLSDAPSCAGCCTPNWGTVNSQVAAQVTADGNRTDVLYYGLIATGVPMGPVIGCETAGVSAGGVGNGVTLAHELGHHCGFPHAPCGSVGTPDATFPAYEPYDPAGTPQASIGEYGLDISNGNVMSPASFKDMMSYCGPRWISLHNHGKLLNHAKLDPRRSCVDYPWWRDVILYDRELIPEKWLPDPPPDPFQRFVDPVKLISIIGVMRSERELEITSVMRVETGPSPVGGRPTDMIAALVGKEGEVFAEAAVQELRSQAHGGCGGGCGDGPRFPAIIQALIPDVAAGARLVLRRGEQELWSRNATARKPRVSGFAARLRKDRLALSWKLASESEAPEIWVQWTSAGERGWHALATGLSGDGAELDISLLPSGAVRVRLLASDGFHTAASKPVAVKVPQRGPAVSILAPREGQTLVAGSPMRLWAAATDAGKIKEKQEDRAQWLLDGKAVAGGLDAFVTAPRHGRHRLELVVKRGGLRSVAALRFVTVDPLHETRKS